MNIIKTLRDLREHCKHTQETLAQVMGVDQATYSRYENGDSEYQKNNTSITQAVHLAQFYGLNSLDDLNALINGEYTDYINKKKCKTN
jgi:transcriptional regulator with XRE-family HTH domain